MHRGSRRLAQALGAISNDFRGMEILAGRLPDRSGISGSWLSSCFAMPSFSVSAPQDLAVGYRDRNRRSNCVLFRSSGGRPLQLLTHAQWLLTIRSSGRLHVGRGKLKGIAAAAA